MTELHVNTQSEAWLEVVRSLLGAPTIAPRGLKVREAVERVSVVIASPGAGFVDAEGRNLNHAITAIEGTSLVGQTSVPELITDRVHAFTPFADDGVFWGAYGPRIAGDLGQMIRVMRADPDTRQAVLTLYDSGRDIGRAVKDVPCTVAIQFFLRTGRLDMWVMMRSNDAWLGLPYDLGQFSLLQFAVAQALDVNPGTYTHSVGSMHLYERDWDKAASISNPRSTFVGDTFGVDDIDHIGHRCRRILLGQGDFIGVASPLELWLIQQIARTGAA